MYLEEETRHYLPVKAQHTHTRRNSFQGQTTSLKIHRVCARPPPCDLVGAYLPWRLSSVSAISSGRPTTLQLPPSFRTSSHFTSVSLSLSLCPSASFRPPFPLRLLRSLRPPPPTSAVSTRSAGRLAALLRSRHPSDYVTALCTWSRRCYVTARGSSAAAAVTAARNTVSMHNQVSRPSVGSPSSSAVLSTTELHGRATAEGTSIIGYGYIELDYVC